MIMVLLTEISCLYAALLSIAGFTKDSLVLMICFTVVLPIAMGIAYCDKETKPKTKHR